MERKLKILVHDYSGHPFQVQLSRCLAQRGHHVKHLYSSSILTPQGALSKKPEDSDSFCVEGIKLEQELQKYSYYRRWRQEREYADKLYAKIEEFSPDIILASNTPPDVFSSIKRAKKVLGIPYIFWVQDLYAEAIKRYIKTPIIGMVAYHVYNFLEKSMAKKSSGIVIISDGFWNILKNWRIKKDIVTAIPNWAPIEEISSVEKENEWAKENNLENTFNFLYSGTLGLKHRPETLVDLAREFADQKDVKIVVISQGLGADYIKKEIKKYDLKNILVKGFQPFERLPEVLSSGDVLLTLLEKEAGEFSVPSKILSNLCVGRPQLLSVPHENLSANIIIGAGAGQVVDPDDSAAFIVAARKLYKDGASRKKQGQAALAYAEETFNIGKITDKFESILFHGLSI